MHAFNPWHNVPVGQEAPKIVKAIIEIPKGSKGKYELDKQTGLLNLNRVLFSSVYYPANYGLIPQTYYYDHDPLDILVFCSIDLDPLCTLDARVIGIMHMEDENGPDEKIIAVANDDAGFAHIHKLEDLPPHTRDELQQFFKDYKQLEQKTVKVGEYGNQEEAYKCITDSIKMYHEQIRK